MGSLFVSNANYGLVESGNVLVAASLLPSMLLYALQLEASCTVINRMLCKADATASSAPLAGYSVFEVIHCLSNPHHLTEYLHGVCMIASVEISVLAFPLRTDHEHRCDYVFIVLGCGG